MRSKPRRKIKKYIRNRSLQTEGLEEEIMMDAKVFLFLRGSCLKTNLQKALRLSSSIDAETILTGLENDGYVKRIQDPDKKDQERRTDIFSLSVVDGDLLEFVRGIFLTSRKINRKKQIRLKLHSGGKLLLERKKWTWGEESIKRWAKYVEESEEIVGIIPLVEGDEPYDSKAVQRVYSWAEKEYQGKKSR